MNKSVEVESDENGSRIEVKYSKYSSIIRIKNTGLKIVSISQPEITGTNGNSISDYITFLRCVEKIIKEVS